MKIKGVIFDMDGVLLDSEKLYVRFWSEAGKACGYPFERKHALAIRSLARPFAIERLEGFFGKGFDYDKVRNKRIELMDSYIKEHGIDAKPFAAETLGFLKENGIKIALATATAPDRAERYLTRVGLFSYLDAVVCASMVKKGKPEPDIYLKAASELGLKPEECIAVEDSPNGIISAYRAGFRAVMIPDMDEPDEDTLRLLFRKGETLRDVRKLVCEELKNCAES